VRTTEDRTGGLSDFLSLLVPVVVLMVMADSFFFTDWLDVPPTSGTTSSLVGFLKIVVSLAALAVALGGPVFLGVLAFVGFNDWIDDPTRPPRSGCLGVPAAAAVLVLGYAHFYLAYLVYESLGALR
jgi:hypothetical protein